MATRLTVAQVYAVARKGGFDAGTAVIATAIAFAESGGNPEAHCLNCAGVTEDSRGLWQINVDAHPDYANVNLADPVTNAKAAYAISSKGRNFGPWSTYKNGAYFQYIKGAEQAQIDEAVNGHTWLDGVLQSVPVVGTYLDWAIHPEDAKRLAGDVSGAVTGPIKSLFSWTEGIAHLAGNLLDPKFWLRIGQGLAAVMLITLGFILIFKDTAVSTVSKVAKEAVLA